MASGIDALIDINRKKCNLRNRVEEATETAIATFAIEQPTLGQVRVSNELRKRGIVVSPTGVRYIWLRRDLESFKKRLAALETHCPIKSRLLHISRQHRCQLIFVFLPQ